MRMPILVLFQRWQDEVDRLLFVDLTFFVGGAKTSFDKRKVITKILGRYNSAEDFQAALLVARKVVGVRHLKQPYADLKLPDLETSRTAFWLMVSEAINFGLGIMVAPPCRIIRCAQSSLMPKAGAEVRLHEVVRFPERTTRLTKRNNESVPPSQT